jgi:hypothetical protein
MDGMQGTGFQRGEGGVLSRKDQRRRNERIVAAAKRGLGPSALSDLFDLTPQRIGQILAKAESAVAPLSAADAEREIRSALEALDQVLEDFAAEYERSEHGGYRIGAIRGRVEVIMLRLELQARAGIIPRHLAQPAQAAETAALMAEFANVLKRHHATDAMLQEVHEIAVRASGRGRGRRAELEAAAA